VVGVEVGVAGAARRLFEDDDVRDDKETEHEAACARQTRMAALQHKETGREGSVDGDAWDDSGNLGETKLVERARQNRVAALVQQQQQAAALAQQKFQDGAQNVQQLRVEVEQTTKQQHPAAALAQQLRRVEVDQHFMSVETALHIVLSGTAAPEESSPHKPARVWLRPHGRPPDHAAHSGCELPECSLRRPIER
jgi:hypothetical protein